MYTGIIILSNSKIKTGKTRITQKYKAVLNKTGLKAKNLELEITERTTVENIDYTIELLESLNKLGVKTAIDDFINNLNNRAIVNTIITLAHNLKLRVVAEGVETKEQAEQLKNAGCDIIQGYYYSRPLPLPEIISELKTK